MNDKFRRLDPSRPHAMINGIMQNTDAPVAPAKDQSVRKDAGKLDLTLLPAEWAIMLADLLGVGALKYERDGWRAGMDDHRLIGSGERHAKKAAMGEVFDREIGVRHKVQVAWNYLASAMQDIYREAGVPLNKQMPYDEFMALVFDADIRRAYVEDTERKKATK